MSVQLTTTDLQFSYSRRAVPGDNPRLRGLDATRFNGNEQYEVISFINNFLKTHSRNGVPLTRDDGLKVERMLQKKPGDIQSQEKVTQWVLDNWRTYN